ncbi:MAG: CAP domain-containing protein [Thermoanaerobaculia bacterium]
MSSNSRKRPFLWLLAALAGFIGCAGFHGLVSAERAAPLAILKPELSTWVEDDFPRATMPRDAAERALFEQINADRETAGLTRLLWDEKAASLARAYTRQQIVDRLVGHFLLDGVPPYARLSKGGDLGSGSENSAAYMTSSGHLWDSPKDLALMGEKEMLREKPPLDGHRRAILDPLATHVGVGCALQGGEFRLAEEFTTRGFDSLRVVRIGNEGSSIRVRGKSLDRRSLDFVSVAVQPFPSRLTREEVNSRRTYSYPEPTWALMPAASTLYAVGLKTFHCVVPSIHGKFSFQYQLDRAGLWTFVLYFREKGRPDSYPGGSFSIWVGEDGASVEKS